MNAKNRSYDSEYNTKNRAAIKTMRLQVAVAEPDLRNAVMAAFALAKSGGRELNLDFNLQPDTQAAHLVSSRAGC